MLRYWLKHIGFTGGCRDIVESVSWFEKRKATLDGELEESVSDCSALSPTAVVEMLD